MTVAANPVPFTFNEAIQRFRENAEGRRAALRDWERAIQLAAEKEAAYRKAYAKAIVESEGTAVVREAHAKAVTALAEAERNVARDMKDVAKERVRMLEGERANLNGLADWSKRQDAGFGG